MRKSLKVICCAFIIAASISIGFICGRQQEVMTIEESTAATFAPENIDPLESFRAERQQLRQVQIAQLNEIIHSGSTEAEIVALAQRRLMELLESSEMEAILEGILALRGFEDALVTIHGDSANVMLWGDALIQQQTAVILEQVARETGISAGNVKIIPIN